MKKSTIAASLTISLGLFVFIGGPVQADDTISDLSHEAIGHAVFVSVNCPDWDMDDVGIVQYLQRQGVRELVPNHPRTVSAYNALGKSPLDRTCKELAPIIESTIGIVRRK
jgi:hypothetical protein